MCDRGALLVARRYGTRVPIWLRVMAVPTPRLLLLLLDHVWAEGRLGERGQ